MAKENRKIYILAIVIIVITFLVIFLSSEYLKGQIYVDDFPKQPVNNIKGVEEDPVAFVYTEDKTYGNYIYLENQFPISDEIGKNLEGAYKTFDFKLQFNEKALGVNYEITLEKMPNSDLDNDWVKVYLESNNKAVANSLRPTGKIKTFDEYSRYKKNSNEVVLYKGTVNQNDVIKGYSNYRLRMWISEDVLVTDGNYESKTIVARINVHASGNL